MVITIRLYRQHDLDLIGLYLKHKHKFPSLIRNTLISYVNNEEFILKVPKDFKLDSKLDKIYRLNVSLETKHEKVIKWLGNIKPGYRNAIIKNIMRSYLSEPNVYIYIRNTISIAKKTSIKYNKTDKVSDVVLKDNVKEINNRDKITNNSKGNEKNVTKNKHEIIENSKFTKKEPEIELDVKHEDKADDSLIDMLDQMMSNF